MSGAVLYGQINNKGISVHLTHRAFEIITNTTSPMYVGMELYFTSLVQKKVVFLEEKPKEQLAKITDNLFLYFKPIQPRTSKINELTGHSTEMIALPVTRSGALIPKYIKIDYKKGNWYGDFTWKSGSKHLNPLILNYN